MIGRDTCIWQPLDNLPKLMSLKSFADDERGITISLYDAKENIDAVTKEFVINFPNVYAYRNIDEGYHLDSAIYI
ncbi:hypothetical protein U0035_06270 [Niabella yanshanensis]|uniref:Uncharacterized protein n=1 Tax=Niabella yanshanensis TaxID=577386 RepID=A0ABZ0WC03_9BACT|nr:hypothetical protein [Niabella yanshanensis]WQD39750.1 hypothetical protein U0035_06270 [Niabella yanshanensis]